MICSIEDDLDVYCGQEYIHKYLSWKMVQKKWVMQMWMIEEEVLVTEEVKDQRLNDNPTINSSIVRYDSNCSHKPRGTSKPTFSSPKGYLPSITSIIKI